MSEVEGVLLGFCSSETCFDKENQNQNFDTERTFRKICNVIFFVSTEFCMIALHNFASFDASKLSYYTAN